MITNYSPKGELVSKLIGQDLTFAPGLNLVVGDNGSGKSSLLKSLAIGVSIDPNKYSKSCSPSCNLYCEYPNGLYNDRGDKYRAEVQWGGANVVYLDPTIYEGLSGSFTGRGELEDSTSIIQSMRSSSGEIIIYTLNKLVTKKLKCCEDFMEKYKNDDTGARYDFKKWVESKRFDNPSSNVPTVIIDEPDTHLSFTNTVALFNNLIPNLVKAGWQVILVSHSPLSLMLKDANIIPIGRPEYWEEMKIAIKNLAASL